MKWLAFKMSGFGGLIVPEEVHSFQNGCPLVEMDQNQFKVRRVPQDGVLFDSLDECLDYCDTANVGNRLWQAKERRTIPPDQHGEGKQVAGR